MTFSGLLRPNCFISLSSEVVDVLLEVILLAGVMNGAFTVLLRILLQTSWTLRLSILAAAAS